MTREDSPWREHSLPTPRFQTLWPLGGGTIHFGCSRHWLRDMVRAALGNKGKSESFGFPPSISSGGREAVLCSFPATSLVAWGPSKVGAGELCRAAVSTQSSTQRPLILGSY